jgi:hypothetical protein
MGAGARGLRVTSLRVVAAVALPRQLPGGAAPWTRASPRASAPPPPPLRRAYRLRLSAWNLGSMGVLWV